MLAILAICLTHFEIYAALLLKGGQAPFYHDSYFENWP